MGDSATAVAVPQHLRALEHANHVRLVRADLKRRIGAGEVMVDAIVANPPAEVSGMTIYDLLKSQPRWGRARCRRLLLSLGLREEKQIGTFTERQRLEAAKLLADRRSQCAEQAPVPTRIAEPAPAPIQEPASRPAADEREAELVPAA
jgi:hypothetical protein